MTQGKPQTLDCPATKDGIHHLLEDEFNRRCGECGLSEEYCDRMDVNYVW